MRGVLRGGGDSGGDLVSSRGRGDAQLMWTFKPSNPVYAVKVNAPEPEKIIDGYRVVATLHARTVLCPHCYALIPLSPNWFLSKRLGLRLNPLPNFHVVNFEVVSHKRMSLPTVKEGIAVCPQPDCGGATEKGYLAAEAQKLGEKSSMTLGNGTLLGSIEYLNIYRRYFPIYDRNGRAVRQGRDSHKKFRYVVFGGAVYQQVFERHRVLRAKGLHELTWIDDPMLRGMGILPGDDSEAKFAPGVEALGVWDER